MWALIERDLSAIQKTRPLIDPARSLVSPDGHDKPYWVPVVKEIADTSTGPDVVVSPWVQTIESLRVLRSRTIRDKTPAELTAEDTARVDVALANTNLQRAMLKWIFDAENRVRVLEGDSSITLTQFKAAIKSRIRT